MSSSRIKESIQMDLLCLLVSVRSQLVQLLLALSSQVENWKMWQSMMARTLNSAQNSDQLY